MMHFLGKRLLNRSWEVLPVSHLSSSPLLIYFSASWCQPCTKFTPKLIDFYNKAKSSQKELEIVLASFDEFEDAYSNFYSKMPWLSVPFNEKKVIENLKNKYSITTIPTLIMVNEFGEMLENDCRFKIEARPDNAYEELAHICEKNLKKYN